VAAVGSVPSYTAEVLGEAVWIAEASVALVGWPLPGAGAASGVAHRGRDRLAAPFSRAFGVTVGLPRAIALPSARRSLSVPAALMLACTDLPMRVRLGQKPEARGLCGPNGQPPSPKRWLNLLILFAEPPDRTLALASMTPDHA
jgi:hypothetical protein